MKKFALICAAALSLAGCNGTTVAVANNTLATLAKSDIPAACAIIRVAEGYYAQIVAVPAPAVTTAEAAVDVICTNPPTDLNGAFSTLLSEWVIIQAGTKAPAK